MALVRDELKYPIPPGLILSMMESLILFAIQFFKRLSYVNEKWKKIYKILLCYQNGGDIHSMEKSNAIELKRSTGWWQKGRIRSYSLQLVREEMLWDSCLPIEIWQPVSAYLDLLKSILLLLVVCLSIMTKLVGGWASAWPLRVWLWWFTCGWKDGHSKLKDYREVMIYFWCLLSQFFFEEIFNLLILFYNCCD